MTTCPDAVVGVGGRACVVDDAVEYAGAERGSVDGARSHQSLLQPR